MRRYGAPADAVARLKSQLQPPKIQEVMPENWPAVQLYLEVYGKFEFSPGGYCMGFDYGAVDLDIRLAGIDVSPDTWQRFKYLERLTMKLLNERKR